MFTIRSFGFRRSWAAALALALTAAWLAAAGAARAQVSGSADESGVSESDPCDGFWPTDRMVDLFIDRVTEEMADEYHFDADQLQLTRAVFKERIPKFMKENRNEIRQLMNQFIEAQLSDEVPEVDNVTDWAQRALPLIDEFKVSVGGMTDDMREFLTDDQQVMLDANLAAFEMGMGMMRNKVAHWSEGGYDPETEWIPDRAARERRDRDEQRRMDAEMAQAREEVLVEGGLTPPGAGAGAAGEPGLNRTASQPARPRDEWTLYVDNFIRKYDLAPDQQQRCRTFLSTAQQQRDDYLRRKAAELVDVKKRLESAADEDAKAAAKAEFDKLNAPVERLFTKLRENLDRQPTRAQRAKAAKAAAEAREAGAHPSSGETEREHP